MGNYLKIKKKIILTFLLIFNQLILCSYAINNRREINTESQEGKFNTLWEKFKNINYISKQDENNLLNQDLEELERFVEETFDSKNFDNLMNLQESNPKINNQFNEIGEELINSDINNNKSKKEDKIFSNQVQNKKISNERNLNNRKTNELLLPSASIISTSEFKVPQEVM